MLAEASVLVVEGERLDLKDWGLKDGTTITEIRMESGRSFHGRRFIDATYEGDLMAKAGVQLPRRPRGQRCLRRDAQRRAGRARDQTSVLRSTSIRTSKPGDPIERPAPRRHGAARPARRRRRPPRPGLLFPDVPDRCARTRLPLPKPRATTRPIRTPPAATSTPGGDTGMSNGHPPCAQPQDRHEQQRRF